MPNGKSQWRLGGLGELLGGTSNVNGKGITMYVQITTVTFAHLVKSEYGLSGER